MRRSEIFESFIKIAQEKGMISDDSKKKLEKNPRADSLSISDIEALYGVKPDAPKSMEYENNIMEDAHPESVVISPSYDKLNGLVENNIERQNILLHIVNKTPDGLSTQRKYAEQELILTLVRVANDLDNHDKDELRTLADTCLMQVHSKQMKKQGAIPLIVGGIAAVLGALYLQQHMGFINEGFEKNHQKLIAELDDMINSSSSWGVGTDYKPELKNTLADFRDKLTKFYNLYKQIEPVIADLKMPRDKEELLKLKDAPETDTVIRAYRVFRKAAESMLPYVQTIEENFSSESYKATEVEDKGFMSSLIDKLQVFHGGKGLVADDFDDVVRAISGYKKAIAEVLKTLAKAQSFEQNAEAKIQNAYYESQKDFGKEMPSNEFANNKTKSDIDDEAGKLDSDFSDLSSTLNKGMV